MGGRLLDGSRVATLVRPVDRTLTVLKFALVPLIAIALSLPAIRSLAVSSDPTVGEILLKLIGPLLALAYLFLLQTNAVNGTLDRAIARLRRWVATTCNHEYRADHDDRGIACQLTPSVFRAPVFDYADQEDVLNELSGACNSGHLGEFWFIEGNSGTGKTRAALRFVQRLVRDPELFELGGRCFLYDFSYSEAIQHELENQLGTPRHDDAVLLIDNFQLVNPELLKSLTKRFVRESDTANERLVVFLTRESAAWNLSPGQDVRLLAKAKSGERHRELLGPGSVGLAGEVSEFDEDAEDLIRSLEKDGLASAAQLHLAQVIGRNRSLPPEVVDAAHMLAGDTSQVSPESIRMFALLTAVSMHRGTFSRRSIRRAIRIAAHASGGSTTIETVRLALALRTLQRIGLVPKIQIDATRFIFHEDIARQCVDQLWGDRTFMPIFLAVGEERLARQANDEVAMRAWLIAVEIDDQETLAAKFDAALLKGSYQRMRICLERARKRYKLDDSTLLQLGILLDRAGEFSESRELLADGLDLGADSSRELVVILAACRLEARHQDNYREGLDLLVNHPDPFVAIVGEYWEIHIAAHRGIFDPQRLLRLAAEGFDRLDSGAGHWRLYSLGRIYFDGLRHLYLSGETDTAAFVSRDHEKLRKRLSKQLPTYEALRILYTEAHLIAHVFLPRVAIFGEKIKPGEAANARLKREDVETVESLISSGQRLYSRAREEFGLYGDREESYLLAEALNAQMIERGADLQALDGPLNEYEKFIVGGSQNMLASFPHFYRFRREMLAYFQANKDPDPDPEASTAHLRQAKHYLNEVQILDRAVGNRYGEFRATLLMLLHRCVESAAPLDTAELAAMERVATSGGYNFEQKLLRHLAAIRFPASLQLAEIFRFYPFVNQ